MTAGDTARARRIGLNEGVFRQVNERLENLADEFGIGRDVLDLVCECGSGDCNQRIRIPRGDYEAIRAEPELFAVVPGHVAPDVERVVRCADGYDVVRKHEGPPAALARETDRRS